MLCGADEDGWSGEGRVFMYFLINRLALLFAHQQIVKDFGSVCLRSFTETHDGIEQSLVADDL